MSYARITLLAQARWPGLIGETVGTRYASFLVRCWTHDSGAVRLELEWIQTGERGQAPNVGVALAWLLARLGQPAGAASVGGSLTGGGPPGGIDEGGTRDESTTRRVTGEEDDMGSGHR